MRCHIENQNLITLLYFGHFIFKMLRSRTRMNIVFPSCPEVLIYNHTSDDATTQLPHESLLFTIVWPICQLFWLVPPSNLGCHPNATDNDWSNIRDLKDISIMRTYERQYIHHSTKAIILTYRLLSQSFLRSQMVLYT